MTNKEFLDKAFLAFNSKTLYATGAFGAPVGVKNNRERYVKNTKKKFPDQAKRIETADDDCFLFDCVGLVKGILWQWSADPTALYGGSVYKYDGIPDFSIKSIEKYCSQWTDSDCSDPIDLGEVLVTEDSSHVAIYCGSGKVIEATIRGTGNVQINSVSTRKWRGHGKLQWIEFLKDQYYDAGWMKCPYCLCEFKLYVKEND